MDKINIEDLKIFAHHGVFDFEKKNGQYFYVSATLSIDTEIAGKTDNINYSVDYGKVCNLIENVMTEKSYNLIETVANKIAFKILMNYDLVKNVIVEVKKPNAPINKNFKNISVKIERAWHKAVIAIGSNIGDSAKIIDNAVKKIKECNMIKDIVVSDIIKTKPYGYTNQNDFLNGALICKTIYSPHSLLDFLHAIENEAGRTREIHWGPRTLDLDLIFYDSEVISESNLTVPHPDMQNRRFVLEPIFQIAPYYRHPINGLTIAQLLEKLNKNDL